MENLLNAKKISIDIFYLSRDYQKTLEESPYFFIKWAQNDKRYRISASFKYLNKRYGLRINIVRDFKKINRDIEKIFENCESDFIVDNNLSYLKFIDNALETEIFLIKRKWGEEISSTLVFFSLKYWSLTEYLQEARI